MLIDTTSSIHHHHHDNNDHVDIILQNIVIILSNLAFILPAIECLRLKKHVQAFVYFSILITSSLYHTCKFGSEDVASPGGLCVVFEFSVYFILDHVFAMLTIPCLLLSFTPLDVIIFDFRSKKKRNEKFISTSKKELRSFLFENYFSSNLFDNVSIPPPPLPPHNDIDNNDNVITTSIKRTTLGRGLLTAYKPSFEITKQNILSIYSKSSRKAIIKSNMVGLENIYICAYAYLIAISLVLSLPDFIFTLALCSSSLMLALFIGSYFYFKHGIVSGFKSFDFPFGLCLSVAAATLMLIQNHLPGSTYWITHSIWHVCAAIGQWLLLRSKYRFSCYY